MTESKDIAALRAKLKKVEDRNKVLEKRMEAMDMADVEDEDLKNMKEYFLQRDLELDEREKGITERLEKAESLESAHKERERADLVKTLAEKYKIEAEAIKGEDDPEKKALQLYVERLASGEKKKEEKEETAPEEEVFEHGSEGGKFKKSPLDMNPEELKEFEREHSKV